MSERDDERRRGRGARRTSRVPAGRLERLARFGWMAGEFAAGGLAETTRRLAGRGGGSEGSAFLSGPNAQRLARRLSQMRGAAMKLGQLLSIESDDVLPPEFAEALAVLRSAADTMPPAQVHRVLGREYGKGWEARFRHFEEEPLAAASIGQVHAATAADGRRLALKIQYPGVARSIDSDVENVAWLLRATRVLPVEIDVQGLVEEAKRQLRREADYLREAESLRRYRALVADEPGLEVPEAHADLTTRRILAMDLAEGRPIDELRSPELPQERRDAAGADLQRLLYRELFEFRFMQTDPNFGNYLYRPETGRVVLLDLGSAREFSPEFAERYARICRAAIAGDREAIAKGATEAGYLPPDEREDRVEALVDLVLLVCEPIRSEGPYDFARSELALRARDASFDLAFRLGYLHTPPPETAFLHRKLAGAYLLLARLRARVDARGLLLPFLGLER